MQIGQVQLQVAVQLACISPFARALWILRYLGLTVTKAAQSFCESGFMFVGVW